MTNKDILNRFKEVSKVKVNDIVYNITVAEDVVWFFKKGKFQYCIGESSLYERWTLKDGVLHYIQKVNNWMGGAASCRYINAEL